MIAEIVILLSIANIVLIILIMRELSNVKVPKKKKKVEEEEEAEDDDPEPEPLPEPDKTKPKRFNIAEKLHLKKKSRKRVSEMPDMNKVMEELQSEFKKGRKKKKGRKRKKNEIQDRLAEIEKG